MNLDGYTIELHLPKSNEGVKELQKKLTDVTTDIYRKKLNKEEYEQLIEDLEESESEQYL